MSTYFPYYRNYEKVYNKIDILVIDHNNEYQPIKYRNVYADIEQLGSGEFKSKNHNVRYKGLMYPVKFNKIYGMHIEVPKYTIRNKCVIELYGFVKDIMNEKTGSWTSDSEDTEKVKDQLIEFGFDKEDLTEFDNFLVNTDNGEYTEIYGIKKVIPWIFVDLYRFRLNGNML